MIGSKAVGLTLVSPCFRPDYKWQWYQSYFVNLALIVSWILNWNHNVNFTRKLIRSKLFLYYIICTLNQCKYNFFLMIQNIFGLAPTFTSFPIPSPTHVLPDIQWGWCLSSVPVCLVSSAWCLSSELVMTRASGSPTKGLIETDRIN